MSLRFRRGSPPFVPPGEIFGPTAGEAAVRANAGARAVSDPGGGVAFTSAADLAAKITANPVGTVFIAANNIDWSSPISTSSKASKIWIPGGRIMDGGGRVFGGDATGLILQDGAELHGGVWQNFGSAALGETNPVGTLGSGAAKLVQDCVFNGNFARGFSNGGSNVTVDHCTMSNNGRYGFASNEPAAGVINTNVRFEFCEWFGNNTRGLNMDGAAGGTKLLHTLSCYIGHCWGHNNFGSGLWFDFNPGAHVVEENVFENNARWGIFYEVGSYDTHIAAATIRNNLLRDNVTSDDATWFNSVQLLVSCTDGLRNGGDGYEIHHNIVDGTTPRAIGFIDHNTPHPFAVKGCHIHDNEVIIRSANTGRVGGEDADPVDQPFDAAANNTFETNHYKVQNTGLAYWRWNGANVPWSTWQGVGHDNTGTLEPI